MKSEWIWAVAICAVPFLLIGAYQLKVELQRRRSKAVAVRPKEALDARRRLRGA